MTMGEPFSDDRQVELVSDHLAGRKVALCVTGGIAAIEAPRVARALRRHGAKVRGLMTRNAEKLCTPMALEWGTGGPVTTELSGAVEHIATDDLVVVAPATLDVVSRVALGLADDPVTTLLASALGRRLPLVFATAMHESLAANPIFQRHREALAAAHAVFVPPRKAEGKDKIALPEEIAACAIRALRLRQGGPLCGVKILVTAGGTRAPVDRFRYLGNRSSGRLGVAIASELSLRGADVTLVYGPAEAEPPFGVRTVRVETFDQMRDAVLAEVPAHRAGIFAAAVLDFAPTAYADAKLSSESALTLELEPTPKIIGEAVRAAPPGFVAIGFKLEYQPEPGTQLTPDEALQAAAARALDKHGLFAVVVNAIDRLGKEPGEHQAILVTARGQRQHLVGKTAIARALGNLLARQLP